MTFKNVLAISWLAVTFPFYSIAILITNPRGLKSFVLCNYYLIMTNLGYHEYLDRFSDLEKNKMN